MRRFLIISILLISILLNQPSTIVEATIIKPVKIEKDKLNAGIIKVKYDNLIKSKVKLMIEKDQTKYIYNICSNDIQEFPLQMGDGNYKISILENIYSNTYKYVYNDQVELKIEDEKRVFLNSIQMIKWDENSSFVKIANEIAYNFAYEEEIIKAIYNYIVNNYSYDYEKVKNLKYNYLPDLEKMVETKQGICYDYSSLFAAMLRSQGIPTKLVMGYSDLVEGYHAWNEVYLRSIDEWIVIDTTYDSIVKKKNGMCNMVKENTAYRKDKEY